MRITPLDIRKQEFRKAMRGLDTDEVYAFLGTVADEYEAVLSDNKRLREHVVQLEERLNEFKSIETNLRNTLMTAERITADAKENARREAELIVRGAEVEADKATESIRAHTQQLRREIIELKKHKDNYVTRMRTLLESHMRMVDGFEGDFAETDREIEAIGRKVEEDTKTSAPAPRMSRERITEDLPPREPADKVTWGGDERREDTPRPILPRPGREGRADDGGQPSPRERGEQADAPRADAPFAAAPELPLEQPAETARRVVAQGYGERLNARQDYAGVAAQGQPQGAAPQPSPVAQQDQWKGYEVSQAKPDWKSYEVPRTSASGGMEAPGKTGGRAVVEEPSDFEVESALSGLTEAGGGRHAAPKPAFQSGPLPQQPPAQARPKAPQAQPQQPPAQARPQAPQVQPQRPPAQARPQAPQAQPQQPPAQARPQAPQAQPQRPPAPPRAEAAEEADEAAGWTMEQLRKNLSNIDRET
ncbi:MAG: DivIVA domain-containing protein [Candidatus Krumholzibacteria bacterium]|nr:DivIVA domain-containing protein [Candidatus Krumholzibacteria bacterium]